MENNIPISSRTKKDLVKDILIGLFFFGCAFFQGHSVAGWISMGLGTIAALLLCVKWGINRFIDEDEWVTKKFMDSIREEEQKDDSIGD